MCNAPGGLEKYSEKWTYVWVRKLVDEIKIFGSICTAPSLSARTLATASDFTGAAPAVLVLCKSI